MVTGEDTAARAGQKHPSFTCSAQHQLATQPLPVHGGRALQVVWVADQLIQDADNLGEAWPLAAVLLPAIQHKLVQGRGAAHGGRQAVAFLHRVNDLGGRQELHPN